MGAARAAWRRVIGLLDTFLMSLSTRLRLLGSTLQACRAVTAEGGMDFLWKKRLLLLPVRAFQRRVKRPQTPTLRQYQALHVVRRCTSSRSAAAASCIGAFSEQAARRSFAARLLVVLPRIVAAAARSGLPRITRENAASYPVPHDLRKLKLKGARNSIERNDDGGSCVLWFWQMTGRAWDLKGRSWNEALTDYGRHTVSVRRRSNAPKDRQPTRRGTSRPAARRRRSRRRHAANRIYSGGA